MFHVFWKISFVLRPLEPRGEPNRCLLGAKVVSLATIAEMVAKGIVTPIANVSFIILVITIEVM
jgi:hypothetical protein